MYFVCNTKCLKPVEMGDEEELKFVREKYLVNAMTVTEAEAKIVRWFPDNYQDLEVSVVSLFDLDSIVREGKSENFYLGRIAYPEESKNGKIKMKSFQVMVNGDTLKEALGVMEDHYSKESSTNYEMESISSSKIIVDEDLAGS